MPYADVNKIKIHYEINGDEYPVICVHGLCYKKKEWFAQIETLSEHFKIISFDNRSCGKSDRPNEKYTIETLADDVRGLMDFLKINKANVMGMSLGGMIVLNFVLKYPNRANKVVLMNTNYKGAGHEIAKQSLLDNLELRKKDPNKEFLEYTRMVFHKKFRKEMEANPKKKFYDIWSVKDLKSIHVADPETPKDIVNQVYAQSTHYTLDRLHEIKNPTLILAASHDRVCPKSAAIEMHEKIQNSTLKIFQNAGHFSFFSRAPEVNRILIDFLKD